MSSAREACLDCSRKHIAQAIVLLEESELGYPLHFWLAIGHLAEASVELIQDHPELAHEIRNIRIEMMGDETMNPPLMDVLQKLCDIVDQDDEKIELDDQTAEQK